MPTFITQETAPVPQPLVVSLDTQGSRVNLLVNDVVVAFFEKGSDGLGLVPYAGCEFDYLKLQAAGIKFDGRFIKVIR